MGGCLAGWLAGWRTALLEMDGAQHKSRNACIASWMHASVHYWSQCLTCCDCLQAPSLVHDIIVTGAPQHPMQDLKVLPEEALPPDGADSWVMSSYLLRR